jgi:predicted transcriptional regulator
MVTVRDGAETRRLRIEKLVEIIKSNPGLEENKIKSLTAVGTGLSRKRIEEYLDELENAGAIQRQSGMIITVNHGQDSTTL